METRGDLKGSERVGIKGIKGKRVKRIKYRLIWSIGDISIDREHLYL